jgi:hypothetical protein
LFPSPASGKKKREIISVVLIPETEFSLSWVQWGTFYGQSESNWKKCIEV